MAQTIEQRAIVRELFALTEGNLGLEHLWTAFDNISTIPRSSGNEAAAIAFTEAFAQRNGYRTEKDHEGNILCFIPATEGFENAPGIVFQGHLDMVPGGEPSPAEHGVNPILTSEGDEKWIKANGTTLGADNGIGVSMMMALVQERVPHGPIALLFTNREETGLESARNMKLKDPLNGYKYLINLDSENEGEATISCAGAGDSYITFHGYREGLNNKSLVDIELTGLMGGHSGIVIGEGRLNAAKVMSDVLARIQDRMWGTKINLITMTSGTARNAIPNESKVTIAIDDEKIDELNGLLQIIRSEVLVESQLPTEQNMSLTLKKSDVEATEMYDVESTEEFIEMLNSLPDGLIKYSDEIPDFPETSTNIGVIRTSDDGNITIQTMTRSSKKEELDKVRENIRQIAELVDADVEQPDSYTGWPAVIDSDINRLVADVWRETMKTEIEFGHVHGGLECGVLLGKFPHLQAISIGPQIDGAHTTSERVNVGSVNRYYHLLKEIIRRVSQENI